MGPLPAWLSLAWVWTTANPNPQMSSDNRMLLQIQVGKLHHTCKMDGVAAQMIGNAKSMAPLFFPESLFYKTAIINVSCENRFGFQPQTASLHFEAGSGALTNKVLSVSIHTQRPDFIQEKKQE